MRQPIILSFLSPIRFPIKEEGCEGYVCVVANVRMRITRRHSMGSERALVRRTTAEKKLCGLNLTARTQAFNVMIALTSQDRRLRTEASQKCRCR